jgi:tetratricopeptide (TPR) repeat protein
MEAKEAYDIVVQVDYKDAIQSVEKKINDNCLRLALSSLAYCRRGRYTKAKKLISAIDEKKCDRFSKSVLLEAKMLISVNEKTSFDKLQEMANHVLSINPKAAFARSMRGQVEIKKGNIQKGIDYKLSVLEDYPNAKWVYLSLVTLLALVKEYENAQIYVAKTEPFFRRFLYYVLVRIILPYRYRWFWAFGIFLIFVVCGVSPSILFVMLMIPLLIIVFYGINKRDHFIYNIFLGYSMIVFFSFLIMNALKN